MVKTKKLDIGSRRRRRRRHQTPKSEVVSETQKHTTVRNNIKKAIIKASRDIRKKHLLLKLNRNIEDETLEKMFKPISEPIKNISIKTDPYQQQSRDHSIKGDIKQDSVKHEHNSSYTAEDATLAPDTSSNSTGILLADLQQEDNDAFEDTAYMSTPTHAKVTQATTPHVNRRLIDNFEEFPPLARRYLQGLISDTEGDYDTIFGVTYDDTVKWKMGTKKIGFDILINADGKQQEVILLDDKQFPATQGLYRLIFLKSPTKYTAADIKHYTQILKCSEAIKKNAPNSTKFKTIIKNIVAPLKKKISVKAQSSTVSKTGSGIPNNFTSMTYNTKPIEYLFWDNVNELVDRLRLLHASQAAGNSSHDNEIQAILDELRESKIIR